MTPSDSPCPKMSV